MNVHNEKVEKKIDLHCELTKIKKSNTKNHITFSLTKKSKVKQPLPGKTYKVIAQSVQRKITLVTGKNKGVKYKR